MSSDEETFNKIMGKIIDEINNIKADDSYIIIISKPNSKPIMVVDDYEKGERTVMEGEILVSTHKINALDIAKICLSLSSFPDVDGALRYLVSKLSSFEVVAQKENINDNEGLI